MHSFVSNEKKTIEFCFFLSFVLKKSFVLGKKVLFKKQSNFLKKYTLLFDLILFCNRGVTATQNANVIRASAVLVVSSTSPKVKQLLEKIIKIYQFFLEFSKIPKHVMFQFFVSFLMQLRV